MGDGGTNIDGGQIISGLNFETPITVGILDRSDLANISDDAGKHSNPLIPFPKIDTDL